MKKKEKLVEDGINFNELMFQAFVNAYQSNIGHNLNKFKSSHFYLRQFVSQVRDFVFDDTNDLVNLNEANKGNPYELSADFLGYERRQMYRKCIL